MPTEKSKKSAEKTKRTLLGGLKTAINDVGKDRVTQLIAHHEPKNYDRTLFFKYKKNALRLCARCTGVYLGIILGITATILDYDPFTSMAGQYLMALMTLPAVIDWSFTRLKIWKSNNPTRITTGLLMGLAYPLYWLALLQNPLNPILWTSAITYALIAALTINPKKSIQHGSDLERGD